MFIFNFDDYLKARFCCAEGDDGGEEGGGGSSGGGNEDEGGEQLDGGGLLAKAEEGSGDGEGEKGEGGGDSDDGDKGATNVFKVGDEEFKVPEKYWDKETGAPNTGALLKSALEGDKAVKELKAEVAEAKKSGKGEVPEKADGYLAEEAFESVDDPDGNEMKVVKRPEGLPDKVPDIPSDDPVLKDFAERAHKRGITTEQFVGIVHDAMELAGGVLPDPIDPEKELQKLGDSGRQMAQANRVWLDGLYDSGDLSQSEWTRLMNVGRDAVGVSAIEKLRAASGHKPIPVGGGGVGDELPSAEEWYKSMPNRNEDPDAYAKWQKQGEQLFGTQPAGTSPTGLGVPASRGVQLPENNKNKKKA